MIYSMTFVAAVNSDYTLRMNLMKSPPLQGDHPHQVIITRGAKSAAEVYNAGLEQATNPIVVFLHQDVYLPERWPEDFQQAWTEAEAKFGKIGVAGAYGLGGHLEAGKGTGAERTGRIMSHGKWLKEKRPLPAKVDTLDELLLALPRDTALRFDARLGFHLYGCDIAMQANAAGLVAAVLPTLCHHNNFTQFPLSGEFSESMKIFREKWKHRVPVHTPCTAIR